MSLFKITHRKSRYFMLRTGNLEYYEDSTMRSKRGDLVIDSTTHVDHTQGGDELSFIVTTGDKSLVISASSAAEKVLWILTIRNVTAGIVTRDKTKLEDLNRERTPRRSANGDSQALRRGDRRAVSQSGSTLTESIRSSEETSTKDSYSDLRAHSNSQREFNSEICDNNTSTNGWEQVIKKNN
jgi:hypothetical protein